MSKEKWNERFSEEEYVYGEIVNEFIRENSSLFAAQAKVGCFAEGEGRNAIYLASLGYEVTAYDQSENGLEKTRKLAEKHQVNVGTISMDLTKEKADTNQFDAAIMVFGHVPKPSQHFFIENIINSVKPGGHILFEVYSEDQLAYKTGGPPFVENLYDPASVLDWIKSYKCLHFYYGDAVRNEGTKHTGLGSVIQVAIRKE